MLDMNTMGQITPDQLRSFLVAADTGSFTKAATLVHRTQAAVSMQMKKMESELDCALFNREGRGVTLTAEGEILYRYAAKILALHDEALAAIATPKLDGTIRLGVPDDYATQHLPGVLKEFAITHPRVQVDVYCGETPRMADMLNDDQLDLVITTDSVPTTYSAPLELVWIVPERMVPADLAVLPLALFHPVCCYRDSALRALDADNRAYRIAYGSPSLAGVLAAVQGGLAIAPVTADTQAEGCRHANPADNLPALDSVFIDIRFRPGKRSDIVSAFAGFVGDQLGISTNNTTFAL
ncbi:LysR family transcriptional regulator [Pseudodesulfovibrio sp. zrk46]|uniref:LysR family transcriptional regulator n=1 Tax=Pseudodesulfovibrio sp. zrk46 TaxID=2725288 RepID=UPI00144941CE|nr:LysR family transcriptional regulator [Pseudodesulfovibrio sp. zrk46]QJB56765.1 LysR family transcriptional regulator [Pseudodesulfovibrio sp. zrk46]